MLGRFRRPNQPEPAHVAGEPASTATTEADVVTPTTTREKPSRFSEAPDLEAGRGSSPPSGVVGWSDPYGPAPGFVGWFKLYWHDLAAFIFLGAIALWLLKWSPVPYKKYFTVTAFPHSATSSSNEVVDPVFAHPKRKQFVPIIPDAMIAVFTPIVSILLINLLGIGTHVGPSQRAKRHARHGSLFCGRGSFWNANNGCMGVIYSVMTGAVLQIIIKLVVPGLRPHFLTVCDPVLPLPPGEGYGGLYYTSSICRDHETQKRRDEIANAMQSFPSGHSVAAWAGLFYLSLYLNAHLKVFAGHHASYWKLLVVVAPCLAAVLITGSLTMDMSHHWYDVLAGSAIGVVMACLSYRMNFASVWDWRFNHIPLMRTSKQGHGGFTYGPEETLAWAGAAATRRGGWGTAGGVLYGAPGDASAFFPGAPAMRRDTMTSADVMHHTGHGAARPRDSGVADGYTLNGPARRV
ncbi:PAP2 superfamily protein [Geopyxis carbonaria]|nr:PAP2 superfamily protein [Geopyxis carbonaria]